VAACVVIHLLLVSSLKFWAGEWAWGPRYLVVSLPLVCLGLPFAFPEGNRRTLKAWLIGLGLVIELLAISVDHQRFYLDRSLGAFFWIDESIMYKQSALFARPFELVAELRRSDFDKVRALVPGPRPFSMTSPIFGPPPGDLPDAPAWMRQYLVFLVPRPWTLWSWFLPEEQRPGPAGLMTLIGCLAAALSFGLLLQIVRREPRSIFRLGSAEIRTGG
jgi:hypothetical protein